MSHNDAQPNTVVLDDYRVKQKCFYCHKPFSKRLMIYLGDSLWYSCTSCYDKPRDKDPHNRRAEY